jgi:AraC-like DNA-binding protein
MPNLRCDVRRIPKWRTRADCAYNSIIRAKWARREQQSNADKMNSLSSLIPTVRASVLFPVISRLDRGSGGTDALLAVHGLLRSQLTDPYAEVPLARYVALLEQAAVVLRDPSLGLHLGQNARSADLGPLGLLLSKAPTIRSAFERMSRFLHALQTAALVGLEDVDNMTVWTYQIEDPMIWPRVQDTEMTLAGTWQLVRSAGGRHSAPLEVHFEHDAPKDRSALESFFQAPVLFSQPTNRLLLSTADASRPIRNEDQELRFVLERHVGDLLATRKTETDLLRRVQQLIGLYIGIGRVTIDRLAEDLGIAPRTLQRELAKRNTSLRLLLREHRQTVIEARFGAGHCNFADLAQTLGYADATVFWRAFKSWSGTTPRDMRNQRGGTPRTRKNGPNE